MKKWSDHREIWYGGEIPQVRDKLLLSNGSTF